MLISDRIRPHGTAHRRHDSGSGLAWQSDALPGSDALACSDALMTRSFHSRHHSRDSDHSRLSRSDFPLDACSDASHRQTLRRNRRLSRSAWMQTMNRNRLHTQDSLLWRSRTLRTSRSCESSCRRGTLFLRICCCRWTHTHCIQKKKTHHIHCGVRKKRKKKTPHSYRYESSHRDSE